MLTVQKMPAIPLLVPFWICQALPQRFKDLLLGTFPNKAWKFTHTNHNLPPAVKAERAVKAEFNSTLCCFMLAFSGISHCNLWNLKPNAHKHSLLHVVSQIFSAYLLVFKLIQTAQQSLIVARGKVAVWCVKYAHENNERQLQDPIASSVS